MVPPGRHGESAPVPGMLAGFISAVQLVIQGAVGDIEREEVAVALTLAADRAAGIAGRILVRVAVELSAAGRAVKHLIGQCRPPTSAKVPVDLHSARS